jgi:outer membrane protein assembly factor BamA
MAGPAPGSEANDQVRGIPGHPDSAGSSENRVVLAEVRESTIRDLPDASTFENRPYSLKWAPDYLAATPMFASNVGFAGQAVISFSDILSNHILQFGASVYGSISDSDLIFSYYNLANRTNWGVTLYQYRNDFGVYTAPDRVGFESQIYRGVQGSISRPFSKFSRFEFQARAVAVSEQVFEESFVSGGLVSTQQIGSDYIYYAEPGIALVLDQVVYGYNGPRHGRRGRLSVDQAFGDIQATTAVGDFRRYFAWGRSVVFATRWIGGTSQGNTPRIFRIGGASTLRGAGYGELEGNNLALMNLELRFPLLSSLSLGWPLRVGLGGIGGVLFFDFGGAWGDAPRFFLDGALDDAVAGYGFGMRLGLGYFALKYDWARRTDFKRNIDASISYFTIGVDF